MAKPNRGGKGKNKRLPRRSKANIPNSKIDDYILDPDNKNGKSGFFADVLGYTDRKEFRDDVRKGLNDNNAMLERTMPDGARFFRVDMVLGKTKKGTVTTVWVQDNTKSNPRLVTAYPSKEK